MRTALTRTLLLILLMALAGQLLAAPCGSGASGEAPVPMDMEGKHQFHCAPADCGESSEDCKHNCGFCPGHCVIMLPVGETDSTVLAGKTQAASYRSLHTSPPLEIPLRPPILPP